MTFQDNSDIVVLLGGPGSAVESLTVIVSRSLSLSLTLSLSPSLCLCLKLTPSTDR